MTRMISFRVSEDEFEQLRSKSEAHGARSVSDYARFALCGPASTGDGQLGIHELNDGIQKLSRHILRLAELLEDPRRPIADRDLISSNHNGGANA